MFFSTMVDKDRMAMNFWLQFKDKSTARSFEKQMKKRFIFFRKYCLYLICLALIFESFALAWPSQLCVLALSGIIGSLTERGKLNRTRHFRVIFWSYTFVQTYYGGGLQDADGYSLELLMLISVCNSWAQIALIQVLKIAFLVLVSKNEFRCNVPSMLQKTILTVVLYALLERMMKEMWVLWSTSQK